MLKTKIAIIVAFVCICKISVSEQCGYDIFAKSGYILSPHYPSLYGDNLDCYYRISTPEGTVVFLDIPDLHTEQNYDYVYIYDGPSDGDRQLAKLSGTYYNVLLNASTNKVLVHFTSNYVNSEKGFNITFNIDGPEPCGGNVTGSSGSIQSPYYPQLYGSNLDCYYSLSTPEDTALTLEIVYIDLEVCCDFIKIYDGPTDDYEVLGTYTGRYIKFAPINASTNQALVYFHTDESVEYDGFNITFTERAY